MEFESPDVERDFPGLYASEAARRSDDSELSDDSQKVSKKDLLIGKRKDKKDSKKDRGYATLEGESSPEDDPDLKSPSKSKKSKTFKFSSKKEKREKSRDKDKDKDREKDAKDKEKDKEGDKGKKKCDEKKKDKVKLKIKDKKKDKYSKQEDSPHTEVELEQPVFGVALSLAVERSRCHDGVSLPLVVRHCIDHVQQHGLRVENVYKISGIKSRVQAVRKVYNMREPVSLEDYDLPVATSLLKQFLRELPEPVLTRDLLERFEEAGSAGLVSVRGKLLLDLVKQLPTCNQTLLAWLFKHFDNIATHEKENKMNVQSIAVMLSPIIQASERLITALLFHTADLFPNTTLTRYIPPVRSGDCGSVPDRAEDIEVELRKQDSLLETLHWEMNQGLVSKNREEQLWEVQRIITHLKRRLRLLDKVVGTAVKQSCDEKDSSAVRTETEELNLRLQPAVEQPTSTVQPQASTVPQQLVSTVQPQASVVQHPVKGFSEERGIVSEDKAPSETASAVSKVEAPYCDVSLEHAPYLTPALKQHAPGTHGGEHVVRGAPDVARALDRHPMFQDQSDPLIAAALSQRRTSSFRNTVVSRGSGLVRRHSSFRSDFPLVTPRPRPSPAHAKVWNDRDGQSESSGGSGEGGRVDLSRRVEPPPSSIEAPWTRPEPLSLPANINHFKPSESLEVEEINKPSLLIVEKKQLAVLETEELTNVIINLRALCQLETKEINRISARIKELGGRLPAAYCQYLSEESDEEATSLPVNFDRNGLSSDAVRQMKWESKRLKHQRNLLLKSICAECEACISLRVQIKLLQMSKNSGQALE